MNQLEDQFMCTRLKVKEWPDPIRFCFKGHEHPGEIVFRWDEWKTLKDRFPGRVPLRLRLALYELKTTLGGSLLTSPKARQLLGLPETEDGSGSRSSRAPKRTGRESTRAGGSQIPSSESTPESSSLWHPPARSEDPGPEKFPSRSTSFAERLKKKRQARETQGGETSTTSLG